MEIRKIKACVFTGAGTTMEVARRFAAACGVPAEVADITPRDSEVPEFEPGDLAVFAVPSYMGRVPAPAAGKLARAHGAGTPAVLLVTYGNRAVDDTFIELADIADEHGFVPVALGAIVAHHSLMVNVAIGRPDDEDLAVVDELAARAMDRLAKAGCAADAAVSEIPGGRPYRDANGTAFKPVTDAARCARCGVCVGECPTGAIDPEDPTATDAERCVSCFRCIAACPAGARSIGGGEALAAARASFGEKLAERKDSYMVL